MQSPREIQTLTLHVQELRRLNALLEQDNACVRQQLRNDASKLQQKAEELRVSQALVQDLRLRLGRRDNDVLYAQELLRREKCEHEVTLERVQELLGVYAFLVQQKEAVDAERDELDTEREEFETEKAELEEAKEELEEAQEKLEEEQEELEAEKQELEDEKEELEAERDEMGEEVEAWRQRSDQLKKRVKALSTLLPPADVEAVKRANPVCPEPDALEKPKKRKCGAGRSSKSHKKARR